MAKKTTPNTVEKASNDIITVSLTVHGRFGKNHYSKMGCVWVRFRVGVRVRVRIRVRVGNTTC